MNEFNYRQIHWQCTCGQPRQLVKTGVTSLGELCAIWKCTVCGKDVMARIPLEKLIADIPPHPENLPLRPPMKQLPEGYTDLDRKLAHDMHIDLGGGNAA